MTIRLLSNDALQDLKAEAFAMVHAFLPYPPGDDGCWDDRSFSIAMMEMVEHYVDDGRRTCEEVSEEIGKDGSPYWSPDAIAAITHFTNGWNAALAMIGEKQ